MWSSTVSVLLLLAAAVSCSVSAAAVEEPSFAEVCLCASHLQVLQPITNLSLLLLPQTYLKRFFNLTEQSGPSARWGVSPMSRRLREMQRFFGLQVTGTLDTDTLEVMKKPRCGIPDINIGQFSTFGNNVKWQKNTLTYR